MDLKTYIFISERTGTELASKVNCSTVTITSAKRKRRTPSLMTALKLMHLSGDMIKPLDLLSDVDMEEYTKWLNGNRAEEV